MAFTEDYLKAQVRQQGYLDILLYTPPKALSPYNEEGIDIGCMYLKNLSSDNILDCADITKLTGVLIPSNVTGQHSYDNENFDFSDDTIATLEENLWILNGNFLTLKEGETVPGYISDSVSDDNCEFESNPIINADIARGSYGTEINPASLSIVLNSTVPTAYPKEMILRVYDANDEIIYLYRQLLEWEEDSGEVDDMGEPIMIHKTLDTLPTVTFNDIVFPSNQNNRIEIEFIGTHSPHRRIRVSAITDGTLTKIDRQLIVSAEYTDKASYVNDTLPTRTFKFELNNYSRVYDIDNPENSLVSLDDRTIVLFRSGYNTYGYEKDENGNLILDEEGYPIINNPYNLEQIEWEPWRHMRLTDVSATSGENVIFECNSVLDTMNQVCYAYGFNYWEFTDSNFYISATNQTGMALDSGKYAPENIEWASDGIVKPTYSDGQLLPYEQWVDTNYRYYKLMTVPPTITCKEILQLVALSTGSTLLIKNSGKLRYAYLDINKPETFTNHHQWTYKDFEKIPEPEQLNSISGLKDIAFKVYDIYLNYAEDPLSNVIYEGQTTENGDLMITHENAIVRQAIGDPYVSLYQGNTNKSIVRVTHASVSSPRTIKLTGRKIYTRLRTLGSENESSVLEIDTKLMNNDVNSYNPDGSIDQTDMIRRKYADWYSKKFKYKITTRGEPLTNAGDYCTIQTQFAEEIPGYILQNHWKFDGTWSGDMEVIALESSD